MARPHRGDPTRLPVEPFAEAFLRSRMQFTDLAKIMGWYRNQTCHRNKQKVYRRADATKAARVLGLRSYSGGRRGTDVRYKNTTISEEHAWKLMRIFDLDPVDVGL